MKKFAVYIRVSTRKQGNSGLGLESQQKICGEFIKTQGGERVAEFKDVESGTHRDRKGLLAAIDYCKRNDCALVIAKLDRLARDVEFCFKVVNTGIEIHFCDMPQLSTLMLGIFATVAQYERELTSDRTTKALAAKKARGEALGGATDAWRDAYDAKSDEQKHQEGVAKGRTKNARHMESRDVQAFLKVLRNVFPEACTGDVTQWNWDAVNTKEENRGRILAIMRDYKELDSSLFVKWNLDVENLLERKLQVKLAGYIASLRASVKTSEYFKDTKL